MTKRRHDTEGRNGEIAAREIWAAPALHRADARQAESGWSGFDPDLQAQAS